MLIYNVKDKVVQLHMLKYEVTLEKTTEDSQGRLSWTWVNSTTLSLHLNMRDGIRMTVV